MGLVRCAALPCVLWGGGVVGCAVAVVNPWWLNLWRVVEGVVLNRRAAPIFFFLGLCITSQAAFLWAFIFLGVNKLV